MRRASNALGLIAALLSISIASAAPDATKPAKSGDKSTAGFCDPRKPGTECGWFYGADFDVAPVEEEQEPEQAAAPPPPTEAKPTPPENKTPPFLRGTPEERCKAPETWQRDCGWVDPGTNYAFMKRQEEELAQQMVMTSNSQWAVKQYQKFVLWAVDRVGEVASTWSFNAVQDQELNPALRNVTSRQGLRWASSKAPMERAAFFDMIKEDGGFLVYWSKSDCFYCKKMTRVIQLVSKESGLEVWNASLDGKCEDAFKDRCMTAPATLDPAAMLGVRIVPDLMLYMPKEKAWLRVGSGVEAAESILSRMKLYASGVRSAAITGTKNALPGQANTDFRREVNQIYKDTGFKRIDAPATSGR